MGLFDTNVNVLEIEARVDFSHKESGKGYSLTSLEYTESIGQLPTCTFTCWDATSVNVPHIVTMSMLKDIHLANMKGIYDNKLLGNAVITLLYKEYTNGVPQTKTKKLWGFVGTPTTSVSADSLQQTYTLLHPDYVFSEFDTNIYSFYEESPYGITCGAMIKELIDFKGNNLFGSDGILYKFIKALVEQDPSVSAKGTSHLNNDGNTVSMDHIRLQQKRNKVYFEKYIAPFLEKNKDTTDILSVYLNNNDLSFIEQELFKMNLVNLFKQSGNFFDFIMNICSYFNLEYIPTFVCEEDSSEITPSTIQVKNPVLGEVSPFEEKLTTQTFDLDYSKNLFPVSSVVVEGRFETVYGLETARSDNNHYQSVQVFGRFPQATEGDKLIPEFGSVVRVSSPGWLNVRDKKGESVRTSTPKPPIPSGAGESSRNIVKSNEVHVKEQEIRENDVKSEASCMDALAKNLFTHYSMENFRTSISHKITLDYPIGHIYDVKLKTENSEPLNLFKGYCNSRSFSFVAEALTKTASMSSSFSHVRIDDWLPPQLM